jgi:septum formation protein
MQVYLASQSPRRRALLQQIGVRFRVLAADVNESPLPRETPEDYVLRIARIKAEVAWMRVAERRMQPHPVLAADTAVILGRQILGKPATDAAARAMLQALSGRSHRVLTSVAVAQENRLKLATSESRVKFRRLSDAEIAHYVASGEPHDKAGGYGIQGLAACFIARIEGSYSGVMGLPLFETARLLKTFGIAVL